MSSTGSQTWRSAEFALLPAVGTLGLLLQKEHLEGQGGFGYPGNLCHRVILGLYGDDGNENGNYYSIHGLELAGQGDLVSRLIVRIFGVTIWPIRAISILTKST